MAGTFRNEFGQSRSWDEIVASGYITLWEYKHQLKLGCNRDDLSWEYLKEDGTNFLDDYGIEGEFAYGVNLTPSRYVLKLLNFLSKRLDGDIVVIDLQTERAKYMDWDTWEELTGNVHKKFQTEEQTN